MDKPCSTYSGSDIVSKEFRSNKVKGSRDHFENLVVEDRRVIIFKWFVKKKSSAKETGRCM
jgi:hypothetical protein